MVSIKLALGVAACTLAVAANAVSFAAPILANGIPSISAAKAKLFAGPEAFVEYSKYQRPSTNRFLNHTNPRNWTVLPVVDISNHWPVTVIGVGIPPQSFKVAIDIYWSTLFVPAANCKGNCAGHSKYNHSDSQTYRPNGTISELFYYNILGRGSLSYDTLCFLEFELPNQPFLELDWFSTLPNIGHESVDGALGLGPAPDPVGDALRLPGPLLHLAEKKLLDRNLFALKLGRDSTSLGEIRFGAVNPDLYTGPIHVMPESQRPVGEDGMPGSWRLDADSVQFGDSINATFENGSASLSTVWPWISIPVIGRKIRDSITNEDRFPDQPWGSKFVDCAKRADLPDFTVNLNGRDFTISGYDYTLEMNFENYGLKCQVVIDGRTDGNVLLLGGPFLRAWYSVFDLDRGEIGLAALKDSVWRSNDL